MKLLRNKLLAETFMPMSLCSIDDGESDAGGGSSGGDQSAGNAETATELTTEQSLEKEFGDPNTADDETEEDEGSSSDADSAEDEEDDAEESKEGAAESEVEEAAKPKNRTQERIDELTAEARYQEREAEKWRKIATDAGAAPDADGAGPVIPEEPDPEQYPYGEHDAEYIRSKAKYDAKIEMLEEQAVATLRAETSLLEAKWSKTQAAALERYPDFKEKVVDSSDKWPCSLVMAFGIKDSEVGADVAYEMATNVDEAARISKLSPLEQAREFGRIEQRHLDKAARRVRKAEQGANDDKPKPKVVTKAPEPPRRRVGGGGGSAETSADTDDFAAFERMADAKLKNRA